MIFWKVYNLNSTVVMISLRSKFRVQFNVQINRHDFLAFDFEMPLILIIIKIISQDSCTCSMIHLDLITMWVKDKNLTKPSIMQFEQHDINLYYVVDYM